MNLEKMNWGDRRLILACIAISVVSLFVGVKYYFLAFPEASIEFRVTKESSLPVATAHLATLGLDPSGYRHAAVFGFDDQQKTFLERELGVAESNKLLETTVRLWRWKHRWFRPLQKEELSVEVTTKGEVVDFRHLLAEDAKGSDLPVDEARKVAESFLAEIMGRRLDTLSFVQASTEKRPHRTDHSFTWKVNGSEVKGADYRLEVNVAGASVAGYGEHLKVPDTWVRDYAKLRSKNEVAGQIDSVFLLLTVLAMLTVLGLRIRRGDVRWKAATILGAIMFALMALSQFNTLPSALYAYDTTTSFPGFLAKIVLAAIGAGLGSAVLIFLLTSSAEPGYRERFPDKLSLTSLLRLRAFRSREFFVATLVGITLTCFFFAYENVFYLIANALGAWAPREVAYSDLLSTAFPWIYVLFFGFLPAISEEFISRMFSIPFFEKIFKSTVLAVVVAAFIWGFGHAGYPNQPFWIRGLEVGLAGIVFGVVLLRFGIAAVVICHFSVDALYTGFVLIRSPNLYYRISGGLSAGIFFILLLASALAYWRKGGFLRAEVTNEAEGVAPEPEPQPKAEATGAGSPAIEARPLAGSRIAAGLVLAATLIAVGFLPVERFGDWVRFKTTRDGARQTAAAFLKDNGFDVSSYRSLAQLMDRTDPTDAAYLLKTGGLGVANTFHETLVPTPLWRVRFYLPGQKEEYWVSVSTTTGTAVGFDRTLLDDAEGATAPKERALLLAEAFLEAHGVDPAAGELKEQTEKDEKARRDHTLVWEFKQADAGEASVRQRILVQGDAVGAWTRDVKIPEDWRRDREKETALTVALKWMKLPLFASLAVFALLLLVAKIRTGEIPWKFAFAAGALVAVATLIRMALSLDALWARYSTSMPAGAYYVVIAIGLLLGTLGAFVAATLIAALAGALYPRAVTMLAASSRRQLGRDALVSGWVALGLVLGLPTLRQLIAAMIPTGRLISGVSWPAGIETVAPFFAALCNAVSATVFVAGLAAIVAAVVSRYFKSRSLQALLAALFVLSFLPGAARNPAEYVVGALSLVLTGAAVVVLIRFFLRDNPLAWLWSAWFGLGGNTAIRLLDNAAAPYRLYGVLLSAVILASAFRLYVTSRGAPPAARPA